MQLTQEQELGVFKSLAYKSTLETGLAFGFDQHYRDKKSIRNAVDSVAERVKRNPEKYGVTIETMQLVADGKAHRTVNRTNETITLAEKEIENPDIKAVLQGVRDKAWRLLDRKLVRAAKSNKRLDTVSFQALGVIAGISTEKHLLLSGQATEHVALIGKIDGNIDSATAIDLVLRMREANVAAKQK